MRGSVLGARYSVLGVAAAIALAAGQAPGDARVMPADGFQRGWTKAGPPRVFTNADLYGHIDGGAEEFLEIGFEQLTVQRYRSGAEELAVELYRMSDPTAARGIYLARRGRETRDPGLRDRHTAGRHQLLLQRHRYYLVVSNTSGGAATAPMLVKAAAEIAVRLPADTAVSALDLLPKAGLVPGSERILRGAFGLQAIYTLGDGDMLQLGGTVTAVSGDYRDAALGPHARIVADYPTPAAAAAALEHIRSNLDSYLEPTASSDMRLVFRDYRKKFGVVTVTGRRLTVVVHLARLPLEGPAARPGTGVAGLVVGAPDTIQTLDVKTLGGTPTRLAWSPDGRQLYVRASRFDRWANETVTHVVISLEPVSQSVEAGFPGPSGVEGSRPAAVLSERLWAARYWAWKSAPSAPGRDDFAIKVETREEIVRTTNVPREGSIGMSTADPTAGLDEVAKNAAISSQKTFFEQLTARGRIIDRAVNRHTVPGRTFGWAPAPRALLAYADEKGRLILMDDQGRTREVKKTKDVSLPAWSEDGTRLAYVQKSRRDRFDVRMIAIP